ncbi:hypothetical protein PTSG_11306 [Salpingoeca rosetta]|uniref:Uncharacterized protein n=1 Tax=Salpingoeca rosetta (strain ATCC 50818 / BSB-021) TaxID=946362 RepID=F2UT10_SALR5|nr:uncharacterized protein PTSG_11306 [Salpingoeca rosetta]EGD81269.1 hypothetical protein PTSG_11306 [Salpingoeca rosetta]|eukprot:XP_004987665.1 hypothetical protein PTSG_11306 [Salpingoeca rosetta]
MTCQVLLLFGIGLALTRLPAAFAQCEDHVSPRLCAADPECEVSGTCSAVRQLCAAPLAVPCSARPGCIINDDGQCVNEFECSTHDDQLSCRRTPLCLWFFTCVPREGGDTTSTTEAEPTTAEPTTAATTTTTSETTASTTTTLAESSTMHSSTHEATTTSTTATETTTEGDESGSGEATLEPTIPSSSSSTPSTGNTTNTTTAGNSSSTTAFINLGTLFPAAAGAEGSATVNTASEAASGHAAMSGNVVVAVAIGLAALVIAGLLTYFLRRSSQPEAQAGEDV